MNFRPFLILAFFFFSGACLAQNGTIFGVLNDQDGATLPGATVVLVTQSDSVLVQFGLSDKEGAFQFKSVPFNDYLFQVSFISLKGKSIPVTLDSNTPIIDLGKVVLEPQTYAMGEVEISESMPIVIKQDTVEYNADSFKTQEGDNVEKLLKKLPGVTIDKDGSIKAHGEDVQKVLVDGKEFFGNDPKIATQNLPADAVNKVQVYDKKSDFAEFSGLDDGSREKTINLTLKEDKKKGAFGDLEVGGGTDERIDCRASVNRFDKKTQISALGQFNNINKQGFSFQDYFNFAGGFENMSMGGSLELSDENMPIPLDFGDDRGLTNTTALGANFNREFSTRTDLQSSVFYSRMDKGVESLSERQFASTAGGYTSSSQSVTGSLNDNYRLNWRLEHDPDSARQILFKGNGRFNDYFGYADSQTANSDLDGNSLSSAENANSTDRQIWNGSSSLSYSQKLRKEGRVFTLTGDLSIRDNDGVSLVDNVNQLLSGESVQNDSLRQRQLRLEDLFEWKTGLTFTEPINVNSYVQFSLDYTDRNSLLDKRFFDRGSDDQPEVLNPLLSSTYDLQLNTWNGGGKFNFRGDKYHWSLGATYQQTELDGLIADTLGVKSTFSALRPSSFFNYKFTQTNQVRAFFNTSLRLPTLQELQPLVDNSDPLNIYSGNPSLEAETNYSLDVMYMMYSQFSSTGFHINVGGSYIQDKIVSSVLVDTSLVQFISPVNANYQWNCRLSSAFDTPIRPLKMVIRAKPGVNFSRGFVFVNGAEDQSSRGTLSGELILENRFKEKLDWAVGAYAEFNDTRYDRESSFNQQYQTWEYWADFDLDLGKRWDLGFSATWKNYAGQQLQNTQILLLESYVSRNFLASERLTLKVRGYDLLNQQQGVFRTSSLNYVEETITNTLGRYVMLSAIWRLSKFKSKGLIEIKEGR